MPRYSQVFVGSDDMMRFECPVTIGDADLSMKRSDQHSWKVPDVGPDSSYHPITSWASHVSERSNFQFPTKVGFDERDNYHHRLFHEDVKTRTADGAHTTVAGSVRAGALTHVPPGRLNECGGFPLPDVPPNEMIHRAESTVHELYVAENTLATAVAPGLLDLMRVHDIAVWRHYTSRC